LTGESKTGVHEVLLAGPLYQPFFFFNFRQEHFDC